jgi:YidC/Oxa1 family membrane protein insertase
MSLFKQILYRPLLNFAVFLYGVVPGADFGIVIIILTALIKVILFPLTLKNAQSQRKLNALKPKIKELQEKHKHDKAAEAAATMELYKQHNVNLLSGCLPLLIQLPVMISLYMVFRSGLDPESLSLLYSFVPNPGAISHTAFGFIDISRPNVILAVVAGLGQFLQSRMTISAMGGAAQGDQTAAMMNKQMLYFFPVLTVMVGLNFPAGLTLYFVVSALFGILEQWYIKRSFAA